MKAEGAAMQKTAIDLAHEAMEAHPEDEALRLSFYERVADSELYLLLEEETEDDTVRPRIFPLEDGAMIAAFDREDRLAAFAEGVAPYVALPGRVVAGMLAGEGLGLALNLGAASGFLMPVDAVRWLAETLDREAEELEARPEEILPPRGLPESFVAALDTKLALAAGLARSAYLVGVRYADGRPSHMLAFMAAAPGATQALVRATHEALAFSGIEAGALDVAFFDLSDPIAARLARVGLRFDLPEAAPVRVETASLPPGMDPAKPPRLR
ncbi:SseB family protein [Haematobacter massiliensis]|nr:SseB family protein [Haematobacter massiliensis]